MEDYKARIKQLRRELTHHAKLYYVYDAPEISDYEYDMLYAELLRLEAEHPDLYDPDSPTQRVGGAALEKFAKVKHTVPMNSLSDVFSFEELEDFIDRTKAPTAAGSPPRNQPRPEAVFSCTYAPPTFTK